ncbi:MAG: hypothetical protein DMF60_16710 [Acidobacteria bacterium]|nr:MAG: hypothetical protein DMF60_16710 [Acidobacteriota bacterium]
MPKTPVSFAPRSTEIRKSGAVVGITDRVYPINGNSVTFDDVLVKGDLSGDLEYNGRKLRVVRVDTVIGLEIGGQGPRGPVWKHVECQVVE